MKKRMTIMVICLVVVFGGLIGFNMFKQHMVAEYFKTFKMPPVTISTVKAKTQDWQPAISAVGNFTAVNGVDVNAQQSGHVVKLDFRSGQYVKKGQLLIELDHSIDDASLAEAKAGLELSKISFKRQKELIKKNATSVSEVDNAQATLSEKQAAVNKIAVTIDQKHIRAPFSGRLGVRLVNLGQFIQPGTTKIVTLQSQDPLFIQFYLPEHHLSQLQKGQEIIFKVQGYNLGYFKGYIYAINSKVDPNTHNVLVQAKVANCPLVENIDGKATFKDLVEIEKNELTGINIQSCSTEANKKAGVTRFTFIPGMFTKIDVIVPVQKNKLVLPISAINYSLYGNSVYVVKKEKDKTTKKEGLKVYQKFVKTGAERGTKVIIESGIEAGDEVVNSGQLKLENGTDVIVNNKVKLTPTDNIDALGE